MHGDFAADQVVEMNLSDQRHLHADGKRHAALESRLYFLGREGAAAPVVCRIALLGDLFFTRSLEFLRRAETPVGLPLREKLLGVRRIDIAAF